MEIKRSEIYRYLGIRGKEPDMQTRRLAEECLAELTEAAAPRSFSRRFPLSVRPDGRLDLTCFSVKSRDLGKNLEGCGEVILFAATLGAQVDLLLRRYGRLMVSRAVVMQAVAAAMIEAYCDEKNEELRREAAARGMSLRPRFSPGYGDFPLSCQRELCAALAAEKTVGITLTGSYLMNPSKSVTAVIGVAPAVMGAAPAASGEYAAKEGCASCGKWDCSFRRE